MSKREQQKLMLSTTARQKLRYEADRLDLELSDVVEHLIQEGKYPESKPVVKL